MLNSIPFYFRQLNQKIKKLIGNSPEIPFEAYTLFQHKLYIIDEVVGRISKG